jgi:hypothetical protein
LLNETKRSHRGDRFADASGLKRGLGRDPRDPQLRDAETLRHSMAPLWMTAMLTPGTWSAAMRSSSVRQA